MVDGIVAHLALDSSGTSEVLKLGEDAVDCCIAIYDFDAGNPRTGSLGRSRQQSDSVQ
jgi:hypothetical protein